MTRFVTFGGQTQFKPGGLTRINANALAPIGLSATGIVHLLGEAEGGPPGSEEAVIIDDPALAGSIYRSGPLADAIRVAFTPSGAAIIPTNLILFTPHFLRISIVATADPPVASMGSKTKQTETVGSRGSLL